MQNSGADSTPFQCPIINDSIILSWQHYCFLFLNSWRHPLTIHTENNRVCDLLYTPKMLMSKDVTWHGLKSHKAHEDKVWSSSLNCIGLQPVQYLLKSQSWAGTDFQYCNWLRCRGNDFIHSEKRLHFYEAHCARHIPEKGKYINLLIHSDIKMLAMFFF